MTERQHEEPSSTEAPMYFGISTESSPTECEDETIKLLDSREFDKIFKMIKAGILSPSQKLGTNELTPIHYACKYGKLNCVKQFAADYSQHFNRIINDQYSPLHCASEHGCLEVVQFLSAEKLFNETIITTDCTTNPLHLASEAGHLHVVTYLCEQIKNSLLLSDSSGNTPLHRACEGNKLNVVKHLIDSEKVDPNLRNSCTQQTPLHVAAENGHMAVVKYLIEECHSDHSCVDSIGRTPVYLAVWNGRMDVIKYLTQEANCDISCKTTGEDTYDGVPIAAGKTALHAASLCGHYNILRYLIEETQCDIICEDSIGNYPIHSASSGGHLDIAKFLIDKMGCDLMCRTKSGCAPVHLACKNGHLNLVKYFIKEKECDPMCLNDNQWVPLHFASSNGHLDIAKFLIDEMGCDPMCRTESELAPVHLACFNGDFDLVKYFIKEKECDSMQDDNQFQGVPLHYASINGHLDIAKFLIDEMGCDPMCKTKSGHAPVHLACEKGHFDLVKYFIKEKECDPMCIQDDNQFQWVPLHFASRNGHLDIAKFLIDGMGCDPMCRTESELAPVHLACFNGHLDLVKYFIKEKECDSMCLQDDNQFQGVPLHYASINGHLDIAKFLIDEMGCDPMCRTKNGCAPVHLACEKGHFDLVKYFIKEKECDPMCIQDDNQFQGVSLHYASINGHLDIAKFLIDEMECDPMCRTKLEEFTPVHFACQNGHFDLVKYFLLRGADPQIISSNYYILKQLSLQYLSNYIDVSLFINVKVIVIGNQGAGKSSLVKCLQQEGNWLLGRFSNVTVAPDTAGVIPHNYQNKSHQHFLLYDFAGHSEFYASHSMVIEHTTSSCEALFILVVDLRHSLADFKHQVEFWVSFLLSSCKTFLNLVVVGSYKDYTTENDIEAKSRLISCLMEDYSSPSLHCVKFVSLDCRKSWSAGINELHQILSLQYSQMTSSLRQLTTFHSMLYAFLKYHINNSFSAIQLADACACLRSNNALFPSLDISYVLSLCIDLNAAGIILLLRDKISPDKSWIVLNQSQILHEIVKFKLDKNFLSAVHNSIGIVSLSLLIRFLPDNASDLIIKYMTQMEYCQQIHNSEILTGALGKVPSEPYFFFPDLVSKNSPSDIWTSDERYKYYCGWCIKCCQHDSISTFFIPRFVQVLQLRIASQLALVAFPHKSKTSVPQLKVGCKIWKNGISWIGQKYEAIVEVIEQNTGVIVMVRCWEYSEREYLEKRSEIIQKVLEVKNNISPGLDIDEYMIDPEQLHHYPLPPTSSLHVVGISEIAEESVKHNTNNTIILYKNQESRSGPFEKELSHILGFDPLLSLNVANISSLYVKASQDHTIPKDILQSIADNFSDNWQLLSEILIGSQSKMFQRELQKDSSDPTIKCMRIIQEAARISTQSGVVTYGWLQEQLEQYSIFRGRNPLAMLSDACYSNPTPDSGAAADRTTSASSIPSDSSNSTDTQLEEESHIPTVTTLHSPQPIVGTSDKFFQGDDLKFLVETLHSAATEWYNLGLQLGVPPADLDNIEGNVSYAVGGPRTYLRVMLKQWLSLASLEVGSVTALLSALKSKSVGMSRLAESLGGQFTDYLERKV